MLSYPKRYVNIIFHSAIFALSFDFGELLLIRKYYIILSLWYSMCVLCNLGAIYQITKPMVWLDFEPLEWYGTAME